MTLFANFLWIVSSWYIPLLYLIGGVLLFPLLPFLWPAIKFSFLPFGRELVSSNYLKQFQDAENEGKSFADASTVVRILGNVVWVLTFGWLLALSHIVAAVINVLFIWTIIPIPNIMAHLRMVPVAFMPFGRRIISANVAKRLSDIKADDEVAKITGR